MPDGAGLTLLNQLPYQHLAAPNLGSAIYLDLGVERLAWSVSVLCSKARLPSYNQRVVNMTVQQNGGSKKTIVKGLDAVEGLLDYANKFARQAVPISSLNCRNEVWWFRSVVGSDRQSCCGRSCRHVREGRRVRAFCQEIRSFKVQPW